MSKREEFIKAVLLNESILGAYSLPVIQDIEAEGKFKSVSNVIKTKKVLFAAIDMINDIYDKIEEVCDGRTDEG